jgi:hypothetical protein
MGINLDLAISQMQREGYTHITPEQAIVYADVGPKFYHSLIDCGFRIGYWMDKRQEPIGEQRRHLYEDCITSVINEALYLIQNRQREMLPRIILSDNDIKHSLVDHDKKEIKAREKKQAKLVAQKK